MTDPWYIASARACTAHGDTPATLYSATANFQRNARLSDALTIDLEGQQVRCWTIGVDDDIVLNATYRAMQLGARALKRLHDDTLDDWQPYTLALTLSERAPLHTLDLNAVREALCRALRQETAYPLAEWAQQAPMVWLRNEQDWQALNEHEQVVWLSADALINPGTLTAFKGHSFANELYPEGLIPGEAAAALQLVKRSNPSLPTLSWEGHDLEFFDANAPPWSQIHPATEGLVNHLPLDASTQAAWHRWLDDYMLDPAVDIEQRNWLGASLGYLDAAGAALGIVCALGRLALPLPALQRFWVIDRKPTGRYRLARLEAPQPSSNASQTPEHMPEQQEPSVKEPS